MRRQLWTRIAATGLLASSVLVAPAAIGMAGSVAAACGTSTVRSVKNAGGMLLELRYNSCDRTIWARQSMGGNSLCDSWFNSDATSIGCETAVIHRNSDGWEHACTIEVGHHSCYTASLNDAGVTSYAYNRQGLRTGSY